MADNHEEVVYSYVGDVSSLREATEEALGLLNSYDQAFRKLESKDSFKASTKTANNFKNTLSGITSAVKSMKTQLSSVGTVGFLKSDPAAESLTRVVSGLHSQLNGLNSISGMTDTSLKSLDTTLSWIATDTQKAQSAIDTMTNKWTSMHKAVRAVFQAISPVVVQLQSFKSKADQSLGKIPTMLSSVAAAFRRLTDTSEGSNAALSRISAGHQKLSVVLTKLKAVFTREKSAIDDENESLTKKNNTLNRSNRGHRSLMQTIINLSQSFRQETREINLFGNSLRNASTLTGVLRNALTGLVGVKLGEWLSEAVKQSISYTENINLFSVAMGDALETGTAFVDKMSELYGMDPSNLMRYAGNFYQLADAIEMPDQASANLSLGLTKAANDIASLFNADIETVFENLSSGMQGMSRAVRKYGMDIRTTTLQTTAASLGITAQVENMSEANRMGLRFITMMKQASNASGDFARTIETPANQLRIFKEQMTQLGRSIGDLFIAPLATAIQYINGFVMALRMVIQFVGSIFGLVNSVVGNIDTGGLSDVEDSVSGIGSAAGGAAKELKNMLAPFDELNILQDKNASGGGGGGLSDVGALDPAIEQAIANMQWRLEDIRMKANEVRDSILEFLGFKIEDGEILSWDSSEFEQNLINKFPQWTNTIQAAFDNWSSITNAFKNVLGSLGEVAQAVWIKVTNFFSKFVNDSTVSNFISGLSGQLQRFADFLTNNQDSIANFVITIASLATAFRGFSTLRTLLRPVMMFIGTCANALVPFFAVIGVISGIIATIAVLYSNSESFATAFNNLLNAGISGILTIVGAFGDALGVVWKGIQALWVENIQPLLKAIGDAMAPVVNTIASLWGNLVTIVVGVFQTVESLWTTVLNPVLVAFFDAIGELAEIFEHLWEDVVGPIVERLGSSFSALWSEVLQPVFSKVIEIVGGVMEIILLLWNNVLAPIINWLTQVFGPVISSVFTSAWGVIEAVVINISNLIAGLLTVLSGLIDFIAGVFSGNWERAWQGIVTILAGIWESVVSILTIPVNAIIGIINVVLTGIVGVINTAIRGLNKLSIKIPDNIPIVGGTYFGFNIRELSTPQIPYLASGAVVTSPTMAMIGEGKYDEAVIPLGNSPQMQELVEKVAQAASGNKDEQPIQVNVYIGNEQVAEYMHKAGRKRQLQTNGGG